MKRRILSMLAGICMIAIAAASPLASAQSKPAPEPMKLNVGDAAPDFKLQFFDGSNLKEVSLSQYRGKSNVVLAFYIFAFTGG